MKTVIVYVMATRDNQTLHRLSFNMDVRCFFERYCTTLFPLLCVHLWVACYRSLDIGMLGPLTST